MASQQKQKKHRKFHRSKYFILKQNANENLVEEHFLANSSET